MDEKKEAADLLKMVEDLLASRKVHQNVTKAFIKKEAVTRGDLIRLKSLVTSSDAFKVIDKQLTVAQRKWLAVCGKSEEDLDNEEDTFSPSIFEPMLDQFGEEQDKLEDQFLKIILIMKKLEHI